MEREMGTEGYNISIKQPIKANSKTICMKERGNYRLHIVDALISSLLLVKRDKIQSTLERDKTS